MCGHSICGACDVLLVECPICRHPSNGNQPWNYVMIDTLAYVNQLEHDQVTSERLRAELAHREAVLIGRIIALQYALDAVSSFAHRMQK